MAPRSYPGAFHKKRWNTPVPGNRVPGISDRFSLQFPFRYLKIVRQHCGIGRKASDAAIGVLKYDDVKFTAAGNLPGNFADSPKQSQLLQQPRRDSTADVTHHDGLSRLDSKYVSGIPRSRFRNPRCVTGIYLKR